MQPLLGLFTLIWLLFGLTETIKLAHLRVLALGGATEGQEEPIKHRPRCHTSHTSLLQLYATMAIEHNLVMRLGPVVVCST